MEALTIKDNEQFLRQNSKEIIFPDKNLNNEIEIVKDFLRNNNCFATASIQLGIPKQLIIIKSSSPDCKPNDEKDWLVLLNPKIKSMRGRTEYWEACKSGLSNFALVERPYSMQIEYTDENGKKIEKQFEGFICTVLSHEIDHLYGVFHMDRAKELLQMTPPERTIFRQTHPYKIFSKKSKFSYKKNKN